MKLTQDLLGCSGGAIMPTIHPAGSECPDDLLAAAIATGSLSEGDAKAASKRLVELAEKARKAAPENKAHDGAGEQA